MSKQREPIRVWSETGYCPACNRVRNLRHEERQLGELVRTLVTCETCHRTLSSSMGVASTEPATPAPAEVAEVTEMEPLAEVPVDPSHEPVAVEPAVAPKPKSPTSRSRKPKGQAPRST